MTDDLHQAEIVVHLTDDLTRPLVCISPERFARLEQLERLDLAVDGLTEEILDTVIIAGGYVPSEDVGKINTASAAIRALLDARQALGHPEE
jgi:hypothetical protein